MPLHRFFTPKGLYTPEDKAAIARAVTAVYSLIPKFYVIVLFIELDPSENIYVGGEPHKKFLRIGVEHIARHFGDDDKRKRQFMDAYEKALEPWTQARNIDWEIQISDVDRILWNMNGMAPPQADTEEERIWKRENRAVTAEEMEVIKAQGRV